MNETVLYHTHFWNEHIRSAWNKLLKESGRRCYLLFDTTNTPPPDVAGLIPVNINECKLAGFNVNKTGFWHNSEYAMLLCKDRIEGDYFWKMDHDVRFTGNWSEFFDYYSNSDSDLIAPQLRKYSPDDKYPWWSSGECLIPMEKRMASLLCIYRVSRKAANELARQYRSGQTGFSEMIVPSIMNSMGFVVTEMMNADFFSHDTFKPGPIRCRTGSINKIEHPIRESQSMLEVDSCRDKLSKWCVGNGLDIGFGGSPIVPNAICIDRPEGDIGRPVIQNCQPTQIVGELGGLGWFTDNSMDWVFSSHVLEDFQDTAAVLKEWVRVMKPGGYLVLFLPDQPTYEAYCIKERLLPNQAHKHPEFSLDYVKSKLPDNVTVVHEEWPFFGNPYSFSLVAKKS